jgi:hypothetical protein
VKTIERKPFAHIIQALRAANNLGANKPTQKSDDEDDEKTEAEDEQEEGDLDKPVKSKPAIEDQEGDSEDEESEELKPKSLSPDQAQAIARRIVRAGEKRRAQAPPELPTNFTARKIVLLGQLRRAEITSDQYERLLKRG